MRLDIIIQESFGLHLLTERVLHPRVALREEGYFFVMSVYPPVSAGVIPVAFEHTITVYLLLPKTALCVLPVRHLLILFNLAVFHV